MKLNPGGENTRLVCARPRDELSSSYLEFAPCMDILDKRNSSASERIDRESQHTWLWMASLPDQGIYFSYSYGLNAEIVVYLNAEVEQTSPRPLRKILSVMHGLHHTNQIIPQVGPVTCRSDGTRIFSFLPAPLRAGPADLQDVLRMLIE